jgi:hypothetical protein
MLIVNRLCNRFTMIKNIILIRLDIFSYLMILIAKKRFPATFLLLIKKDYKVPQETIPDYDY